MAEATPVDAMSADIVFRPVWRLNDAAAIRDVKRFWSSQNLPPSLINGRDNEICAVAYSGGEVVAVSTASIFHEPLMKNKFFGYRCMVAPHIRQRDMAWKISVYSLKLLQEWNAKNRENALGLMICVETDKFETGLRRPVREKFGFTMHFVGYTATGQQLRVVWFDDAILDDRAVTHKGLPVAPNHPR